MNRISSLCFVLLLGVVALAQDNVWRDSESALKNPSFEMTAAERPREPEAWNVFTESGEVGVSYLNSEVGQHGHHSMQLAFDTRRDKYFGIGQEVDLSGGETWKLTAFVRNVNLQGTSHVRLGIEWKDAENRELTRSQSAKIDRTNISDKEWTKFDVTGLSPPGTTHATITVTVFPAECEEGSVLVDTVWLEKLSQGLTK